MVVIVVVVAIAVVIVIVMVGFGYQVHLTVKLIQNKINWFTNTLPKL